MRFAARAQLKQLLPAALTTTLGKQFPEQPPAKLVDETFGKIMDKAMSINRLASISNTVTNSNSRHRKFNPITNCKPGMNSTALLWTLLASGILCNVAYSQAFCAKL